MWRAYSKPFAISDFEGIMYELLSEELKEAISTLPITVYSLYHIVIPTFFGSKNFKHQKARQIHVLGFFALVYSCQFSKRMRLGITPLATQFAAIETFSLSYLASNKIMTSSSGWNASKQLLWFC